MYDRRFAALPLAGMVPGEEIEIAPTRLSVFARGEMGDLSSAQHWLPTWRWSCAVCEVASMAGILVCLGCQSACLFALRANGKKPRHAHWRRERAGHYEGHIRPSAYRRILQSQSQGCPRSLC